MEKTKQTNLNTLLKEWRSHSKAVRSNDYENAYGMIWATTLADKIIDSLMNEKKVNLRKK